MAPPHTVMIPSLMTLGVRGARGVLTSVLSWIALQARISSLIVTVNLHPPWLGGCCASMARVWCFDENGASNTI